MINDKNESSYKQCNVNNLYGWVMSQKLPVNYFKWVENNSQINEDFIKIYNEDSSIEQFIKGKISRKIA